MLRHDEPLYAPDTPTDQVLLTWALMAQICYGLVPSHLPRLKAVVHAVRQPVASEDDVHFEWVCLN